MNLGRLSKCRGKTRGDPYHQFTVKVPNSHAMTRLTLSHQVGEKRFNHWLQVLIEILRRDFVKGVMHGRMKTRYNQSI